LSKIPTPRHILGNDEHPVRVFAHVEQALHLFGCGAPKKRENQRGQIGLVRRSPLPPELVEKNNAAGRSLKRLESPGFAVTKHF
jgi:hypothetical protein